MLASNNIRALVLERVNRTAVQTRITCTRIHIALPHDVLTHAAAEAQKALHRIFAQRTEAKTKLPSASYLKDDKRLWGLPFGQTVKFFFVGAWRYGR